VTVWAYSLFKIHHVVKSLAGSDYHVRSPYEMADCVRSMSVLGRINDATFHAEINCIMQRQNKKKKSGRGNRRNNPKSAFAIASAGDQVVKRLTLPAQTFATGAGTSIPPTAYSSALVQSAPATEWASFAARYQQYRVRAIRITGKTTQPIQSATVAHGALYRGDFIGSAMPASSAQVLSDENVKVCSTHSDFVDVVTWSRNPNAKLWNPTSTIIPSQNVFSWVAASAATPVLTTATTYFAFVVEWEVEFRGSQ